MFVPSLSWQNRMKWRQKTVFSPGSRGQHDDAAAIQRAVDAAAAARVPVLVPRGVFRTSETIVVPRGV
eukprot:COSAG06_NODE_68433_length_226_cov_19.921260_1_plen_67_part_01